MSRFVRNVLVAGVLIVLATASVLQAQSGSIRGRVINAESSNPLPNAQVYIQGTNYGSVSDHQGNFLIAGVPAGSYTVIARYTGYESNETSVSVSAGQRASVNFELSTVVIMGEAIMIEGSFRQGQAKALERQKNSDNIENVVSEDLIETFPDPNVAEAVQRIPGVTIQRDQGEGRYIQVRGLAPRLNTVSINGVKVPSPEGEVRQVAMDVISADLLASIELHKALTPDMDADAIGGSVNLRTKTAHDYNGRVLKARFGGGYNDIVSDGIYQGNLTWGRTFGLDDKWGFLISGNYYKTNRGSENNEFEYDDGVIDDFQLRDYNVNRTRYGFSSTLDYQIDDNSMIYFSGLFSSFEDEEHRRRFRWRPGKGDYTGAYSAEDADIERELKDRDETQVIYSIMFGGDHALQNSMNIDYSLAYSYAEEEEPDRRDATFVAGGVDMNWTRNNDFPKWSTTNGIDPFNPSNFEFDELVYENNLTTDKEFAGQVNFEVPLSWQSTSGSFKFGGKLRAKEKDRRNDAQIFGWEGDNDLFMNGLTDSYENRELIDESNYRIGPSPGPEEIKSFFSQNRGGNLELDEGDSRLDTDPANYDATENVYAGYAQFKFNMGQRSEHMLLIGARLEYTDLEYTGNEVLVDEDGDYASTSTRKGDNSYANLFPMAHYRYRIDGNTNMRMAVTTAISRPDYYWLVPFAETNREDEERTIGNPDLDPTRSLGLDFMLEHFVRPIGIVSGGFFYKNLSDYIYETTFDQAGGPYDGWETTQWQNGESASLWGLELSWQQQLTMLPGVWNGLGLYANYTWTDSDAEFPGRSASATLPGQAEHSGNFALGYDKYGFNGRFSVNFHGKYIDVVGGSADEDEYYDNHVQLDLSLSQKVSRNVKIYADFINLTDEPLRYYYGESTRPRQQEYYSFWTHFGLKFDL